MEGLKSRATALIVCTALILVGWFGCLAIQNQEEDLLTAKAAGLKNSAVMMEVSGQEITADNYLFWLTNICDSLSQQFMIEDWNMPFTEDLSIGEFAKKQAEYSVLQFAVMQNLAEEYSIVLTQEQQTALDGAMDEFVASFGDEEFCKFQMSYAGLSEKLLVENTEISYLFENLSKVLMAEDGELAPTEERLEAYRKVHKLDQETDEEVLNHYLSSEHGAAIDYVNNLIDEVEPVYSESFDALSAEEYYTALQAERDALIDEIAEKIQAEDHQKG